MRPSSRKGKHESLRPQFFGIRKHAGLKIYPTEESKTVALYLNPANARAPATRLLVLAEQRRIRDVLLRPIYRGIDRYNATKKRNANRAWRP